jgi:Protein of unknown function (DUF3422)
MTSVRWRTHLPAEAQVEEGRTNADPHVPPPDGLRLCLGGWLVDSLVLMYRAAVSTTAQYQQKITLPPEHPLRIELAEEVHARPPDAFRSPFRVSYLALLSDPAASSRCRSASRAPTSCSRRALIFHMNGRTVPSSKR